VPNRARVLVDRTGKRLEGGGGARGRPGGRRGEAEGGGGLCVIIRYHQKGELVIGNGGRRILAAEGMSSRKLLERGFPDF
jgi:hypothetical protein